MRGIPKWLNTKEDILNCMQLAMEGEIDKGILKKKLQELMSDEKVYVFKSQVTADYTPVEGERVCEMRKEDDSIEYHCYELQDNPNARYIQMGFSKEELQGLINELG